MKVYIASDHAAFNEKQALIEQLKTRYEIVDLGTKNNDSVNYPHFAFSVVKKIQGTKEVGILLCGSGIGISIAANRFKGIRAALCRDEEDARLSREHNDANIIVFAGRKTTVNDMVKMTDIFLSTEFEGGRHQTRIDLFNNLGEESL
ncbi:MAG: ribose 5-phosphate isomerase B [Bacteriovoracaceae bacterium]